jgi:hypothetical protein
MEKKVINILVTVGIITLVLAFSAYIIIKDNAPSSILTEELAKCIGANSELYIQTGCPACQRQEELFGEHIQYINSTNCFLQENRQICIDKNIEATPTWIIEGEKYKGVQSIEKLKELTGC